MTIETAVRITSLPSGRGLRRPMAAALAALLAALAPAAEGTVLSMPPSGNQLEEYIRQRLAELDQIPAERKAALHELAAHVRTRQAHEQPVRLLFICTHNSRRSHLAQVWAAAAAAHFGLRGIETFSGGTQATAFNWRAVAALERAGFEIARDEAADNPRYRVRYSSQAEPLICFSKEFARPPNPQADFCAVMTCSQADEACPVVPGAIERIALSYGDPQAADGTPKEAATYDQRCAQIARELLFVFSEVAGANP